MKFICDRKEFKDALAAVVGQTKGVNLPILEHVLIAAEKRSVRLTGHNLDSCSTITMPAEVETDGACAIPGDRLNKLVGGLPEGSQVKVETDDKQAKVRAGRSTYSFPILPADDFPAPLTPEGVVNLTLSAAEVRKLFGTPSSCIDQSESRYYLTGIFLLPEKGGLVGVATDGHRLLRSSIKINAPAFEPIIVPEQSCAALVKMVGDDKDVALEISKTLIGATVGEHRFVSKLIDGTFPDYARVIPQATKTPITIDAKDFDAALARLDVARGEKSSIVTLSWSGEVETLLLKIETEVGSGSEELDCDCRTKPDDGEIKAQLGYIRTLIDSMGGENIRMHVTDPGSPIRFENPADDSVVSVCTPCR